MLNATEIGEIANFHRIVGSDGRDGSNRMRTSGTDNGQPPAPSTKNPNLAVHIELVRGNTGELLGK